MTNINNTINYIELPMTDSAVTQAFYTAAFGWEFTVWAPTYIGFSGAGVEGGFDGERGDSVGKPGVLVVLYADDLEKVEAAVVNAGGKVVQPAYAFPGGRRFHFTDPNGNELAVWSEK